jgi:hypothetical protein
MQIVASITPKPVNHENGLAAVEATKDPELLEREAVNHRVAPTIDRDHSRPPG